LADFHYAVKIALCQSLTVMSPDLSVLGMHPCYLTPPLENLDLAKKYLNKAQELGVELPAEVLKKIGK